MAKAVVEVEEERQFLGLGLNKLSRLCSHVLTLTSTLVTVACARRHVMNWHLLIAQGQAQEYTV